MATGQQPAEERAAHGRQPDEADWPHPYARDVGAASASTRAHAKYWPPVGRIDNVYGDRNLFCSCVPISELA
ncbi:Glycine dehydrogenase [decarboxylating] [Hydrogenophaga sp. T4]|nr:Glycine dehydrogenase [decarboxylating] [Hydrogenophaga sp. T4]